MVEGRDLRRSTAEQILSAYRNDGGENLRCRTMAGSIALSFREASHASRKQVLTCAKSRDFVPALDPPLRSLSIFDCSKANAMTLDTAQLLPAHAMAHQLKHLVGDRACNSAGAPRTHAAQVRSGHEIATAPAAQRPGACPDPALAHKARIDARSTTLVTVLILWSPRRPATFSTKARTSAPAWCLLP